MSIKLVSYNDRAFQVGHLVFVHTYTSHKCLTVAEGKNILVANGWYGEITDIDEFWVYLIHENKEVEIKMEMELFLALHKNKTIRTLPVTSQASFTIFHSESIGLRIIRNNMRKNKIREELIAKSRKIKLDEKKDKKRKKRKDKEDKEGI
jgi:hypothetical protein